MTDQADAMVNHIDAKSFMIMTGLFIGFVPVPSAEPLLTAGLIRSLRPHQYYWTAPYSLITRKGTRMSRALIAFMEDIHASLGSRDFARQAD